MNKYLNLKNVFQSVAFVTFFILWIVVLFGYDAEASAADFGIASGVKAIVMDSRTNQIFYEKDSEKRARMASTTKIMTVYLGLLLAEKYKLDLDENFEVENSAICVEGTSMGLRFGDMVSLRSLFYGAMLASGNEAANMIAFKLGTKLLEEEDGNKNEQSNSQEKSAPIERFVEEMNKKAKEIGMEGTHFVTPSGLEENRLKSESPDGIADTAHYSTAKDMAKLANIAINNEAFRKICSSPSKKVTFGNPPSERTLWNSNKMLQKGHRGYCEEVIGVKTGFTDRARRCFVSAAERNGNRLIAVTLGVNGKIDWEIHKNLLNFGFSKFGNPLPVEKIKKSKIKVFSSGIDKEVGVYMEKEPTLCLTPESSEKLKIKIESEPFLFLPVSKGEKVGKIKYTLDGKMVFETNLLAEKDVK